ncbi:hypothetical protein [Caulobacter endophyticus]|uniref:hypothetical protein n=1 Tax=Caulobacter endophyticus TaxID=2172652 RepID=UPI002410568B|nr:hypothetical protein [Caulobacter endophyticus]MDG2527778.1 hypothetical protein [Caulobacter endophyticus]
MAVSLLDFVTPSDLPTAQGGVTDIGYAMAAALASGATYIVCPACPVDGGYNFGSGSFTIGSGQFVEVEGQTLIKSTSPTSIFDFTGYDARSGLRGGAYSMIGAPAGSCALRLRTDRDAVWGVRISGIRVQDAYCAITDVPTGAYYSVDCEFTDIQCRWTKGTQIASRRSRGFMLYRDVFIDNTLGELPGHSGINDRVTWPSAVFADFIGIELRGRFHVVGQSTGDLRPVAYQPNAIGVLIDGDVAPEAGLNRFVWGDTIRVESSEGPGIVVRSAIYLNMIDMEAYGCLGTGIELDRVNRAMLLNLRARGGNNLDGAPASADAISMTSCSQFQVANVSVEAAKRDGLRLTGCTDMLLTNVDAQGNDGQGLVETSGNLRNLYTNVTSRGNSGSDAVTLEANSRVTMLTMGDELQAPGSRSAFAAHKAGTDQTGIPSNTFTRLAFPSTRYNQGGYDPVTSQARPQAGLVTLKARALVTDGIKIGKELSILIYKNNAPLAVDTIVPSNAGAQTLSVEVDDTANGTDVYEAYVYLGDDPTGGANKTVSGADAWTAFSCAPIG